MIQALIDNWMLIVAVAACGSCIGILVYKFWNLPSAEKMAQIREWLLYAVVMAEKEFGNGTGQLKLRYVYDLFLARFPQLSKMITFTQFSSLVDEALEKMKVLLDSNQALINLVEK